MFMGLDIREVKGEGEETSVEREGRREEVVLFVEFSKGGFRLFSKERKVVGLSIRRGVGSWVR